jgi:hypothetical protein
MARSRIVVPKKERARQVAGYKGRTMSSLWRLPPRGLPEETEAQRRAAALVRLFEDEGVALTTAEVALQTGFPQQAAAVALETMRAIGRVSRTWDQDLRIWRWAAATGPAEVPPEREDRLYTIAEAAAATGLSEKAIRRRVERRTLAASVEGGGHDGRGGRRVLTHEALLRAGLLEGAPRTTKTSRGIERMLTHLRGATQPLTTDGLREHAGVPRQVCEVALVVLRAAELVTREFNEGFRQYMWSWSNATE